METAPRGQATPGNRSSTLSFDLLAGLSVAGVLLPEAVAYAGIAGVPPFHALVAALVGLCIYPLLGTSRFAMVAPTSSAAAIFASTALTSGPQTSLALVVLTGGLFLAAGWLRAGFLGAFISRPVLRGFAWALALSIVIRQLPHIVGVPAGGASVGALLVQLWEARSHWQAPSLGLGLGALALWLALHHGLRRFARVPTSLIVLAAGIVTVMALGLDARRIDLVGDIAWGWPALSWPQLTGNQWLRAAEVAPALLLILFAESWGSVRSLALQTGDRVDANRELLALGAGNLLSGLVQGLPVGAGFSAASAGQAAGARTQRAGLAAALALAVMIGGARPWLALLPQAVLAAVVVGILSHHLWPRAVLANLQQGRDAWLALVAAAGVLAFGVLFGMLLAVGLSLALALRRFAMPLLTELGQVDGTRDFIDRDHHATLAPAPGTLFLRPEEPLFFANTEQVLQEVTRRVQARSARVVVLSLEVTDDLDTTAAEALLEFSQAVAKSGVRLLLARVKDRPRQALAAVAAGVQAAVPACYWSVADAALALATVPRC